MQLSDSLADQLMEKARSFAKEDASTHKAILIYEYLISNNIKHPWVRLGYAECLIRDQRYKQAINILLEYLAIDYKYDRKRFVYLAQLLAKAYAEVAPADAETWYSIACKFMPKQDGSFLTMRGYNLKKLGRYDEALMVFEKALESENVEKDEVYNNMGTIYRNQGNFTKASECFRKSLSFEPSREIVARYLKELEDVEDIVISLKLVNERGAK